MSKCCGITRSGDRCKGIAIDDNGLCFAHSPEHAKERKKYASKGGRKAGRGRPMNDVQEIKAQITDLYKQVEAGEMQAKTAAVLNQLLNTMLRAVSLELDVREQLELEARLEELEKHIETREYKARQWHV